MGYSELVDLVKKHTGQVGKDFEARSKGRSAGLDEYIRYIEGTQAYRDSLTEEKIRDLGCAHLYLIGIAQSWSCGELAAYFNPPNSSDHYRKARWGKQFLKASRPHFLELFGRKDDRRSR